MALHALFSSKARILTYLDELTHTQTFKHSYLDLAPGLEFTLVLIYLLIVTTEYFGFIMITLLLIYY